MSLFDLFADRRSLWRSPSLQPEELSIDKFCFIIKNGALKYQGKLTTPLEKGYWYVTIYDWQTDDFVEYRLYHISDMSEWSFFDSSSEMDGRRESLEGELAEAIGKSSIK